MKPTEGHVHVAMRTILRNKGWRLVAGEYPGGSDHELYPLSIVDPRVARDQSPEPRRHSLGELIPDIVALRERFLLIGEAKVKYDEGDHEKLELLVGRRRADLVQALKEFATERRCAALEPVDTLVMCPTLVFLDRSRAPEPVGILSYLRICSRSEGYFQGHIANLGFEL